jgi:DNA-binding SARP family transcriptional activator
MALWRGPPLADFTYESFAQSEVARLEELRLEAVELRIDADLALGRHVGMVAELEHLVAAHPFRERLRGQLMLALYRSGRQAEALEAFRAGREALAEELGLEPSPGAEEHRAGDPGPGARAAAGDAGVAACGGRERPAEQPPAGADQPGRP